MNTMTHCIRIGLSLALGTLLSAAVAHAQLSPCEEQARLAHTSGVLEVQAELLLELANTQNIVDPQERAEAVLDAYAEYLDGLELVRAQYDARLAVCARVGLGAYAPEIDPQDFVAVVDNPLLPFLPGAQRSYRKVEASGDIETVDSTVLNVTREILGVPCTVVHVIERENGTIVEETLDYYAQDEDGNVWYFGELAMNFEGPYLHDLDGSWIAGEDGAQPGILMPGAPVVGDVYRQEFYLGEAEDTAGITALGVAVQVPYGNLTGCLTTYDFSPLEPDQSETKGYAPGLGLVLEVDLETGERLELVSAL
jgi:hypothetical protein